MFRLFARTRNEENWEMVYGTEDLWEAEVVRSALLSQDIPAIVKSPEGNKKSKLKIVSVPISRIREAQMVINRAKIVMSKRETITGEQQKQTSRMEAESQAIPEKPVVPMAKPASEPVVVAEKDDVGKIFFYEVEDVYELRLGMESYKKSHFMSGEEWEEFIDFSAQRQEFFILLKEKYPELADYLKESKMRPNFLKMIEYSYGKSQPPKK